MARTLPPGYDTLAGRDHRYRETALMAGQQTSTTLVALSELGVKISVDDFGTGYSSLTPLTRVPVDELRTGHRRARARTSSSVSGARGWWLRQSGVRISCGG